MSTASCAELVTRAIVITNLTNIRTRFSIVKVVRISMLS